MSRRNRNTLILYAYKIAAGLFSYAFNSDPEINDDSEIMVINKENKDQYVDLLKRLLSALSIKTKILNQVKDFTIDDLSKLDDLLDDIQFSYPKVFERLSSNGIQLDLDKINDELKCYLA